MFVLSSAGIAGNQNKTCTKPKFLLALTGLARSGKDTAAKYIAEKCGFAWFDFSRDVLQSELKKKNLPPTKENMAALGDELRKKYGPDIVARKLAEKIRKSKSENIVVSGVRSPEEALCLKNNSKKFILVKISAAAENRIARKGNADIDIRSRDERDIKNKGLPIVLEMADIAIENNGTLDEFYRKIDAAMASL